MTAPPKLMWLYLIGMFYKDERANIRKGGVGMINDARVDLLKKVDDVTGIFYPIKTAIHTRTDNRSALKNLKQDYDIQLKKAIMDNPEVSDDVKAVLASYLTKSAKEFMNAYHTIDVALDNMSDTANPNNLDDDWLFYFMDKATKIRDEEMRNTWGRILAEACDDQEICSKKLLHILSIISKREAESFQNICKFRMINMNIPADNARKISVYPIVFMGKGYEGYANQGITNNSLIALEQLGLVKIDSGKEFVVYTDLLKLRNRKHSVEIIGDGKIEIGNVVFTYEGFLLQKIIEDFYDHQILDYDVQIWSNKGYKVYLNGSKI